MKSNEEFALNWIAKFNSAAENDFDRFPWIKHIKCFPQYNAKDFIGVLFTTYDYENYTGVVVENKSYDFQIEMQMAFELIYSNVSNSHRNMARIA